MTKTEAIGLFRPVLVELMFGDQYKPTRDEIKLIGAGVYKGTKSQQNGNDLMFLYRGADFIKDRKNVALLMVRIGSGAKVNLYEVPATGSAPASYAVTIGNSSICRVLYVEQLVSSKSFWTFDVESGKENAACLANTSRFEFDERITDKSRVSDSLSLTINPDDYANSVQLVGSDKKQMEDFANIVKLAFSNAR